jgi:polysaccharide biosynthesis protein PslG
MLAALVVGAGVLYVIAHIPRTRPETSQEAHTTPAQSLRRGHLISFGISDSGLIAERPKVQAAQLAAMKAIGITSVRLDANWDWVQPDGPRRFDWKQLDRAVHSVRAAGMSADLIIDGCPPWAALRRARHDPSPQPASPARYATWAAEVAARYSPDGVRTFEIWNEPNIVAFWQPKPNPAAYTADLVAAYSAIKTVDPWAFVISGGLAPAATNGTDYSAIDFLRAMYAHGAKGSFDAVGLHPYSYPTPPDTYEPWSAWSQMAQTRPSIRSVMRHHGDGGKPVWITEFGAPSAGPQGVGVAAQATELTQAIDYTKKTSWIGALFIYTWRDTRLGTGVRTEAASAAAASDYGFGLLWAGGSRKPAYAAVAAAIG